MDKLAERHVQCTCQLVSNLNPNTHLPEFNRADISSMHPRLLRKVLLRKAKLLPLIANRTPERSGTRFNVFRRLREAVLQRSEARQILIDYWMGHSNASMADRYGKQLVEDVEYRQQQVKKVGLGFDLPPSLFGLRGLQILDGSAAA